MRTIEIGLAGLTALTTPASGLVTARTAVWMVIAALGLTYTSQWPLIAAYGSERYTASSGTVFALLVGGGGLGTTVVPYLMGLIGERASICAAMISPAALFLARGCMFKPHPAPSSSSAAHSADTRAAAWPAPPSG